MPLDSIGKLYIASKNNIVIIHTGAKHQGRVTVILMARIHHFTGRYFGKLLCSLSVELLSACSEYYDARCEEQGVERNDWENWNYVAVKVSTPLYRFHLELIS